VQNYRQLFLIGGSTFITASYEILEGIMYTSVVWSNLENLSGIFYSEISFEKIQRGKLNIEHNLCIYKNCKKWMVNYKKNWSYGEIRTAWTIDKTRKLCVWFSVLYDTQRNGSQCQDTQINLQDYTFILDYTYALKVYILLVQVDSYHLQLYLYTFTENCALCMATNFSVVKQWYQIDGRASLFICNMVPE
jgi:hypothetical protein